MTSTSKLFAIVSLAITIIGVFWICTFKILDRDFWWHITAGEIMWNTGELIKTDPFAYTREGMSYVSTHEWLSQVIFYSVWNIGGATGEILFRGFLVAVAFVALLLIDRKHIWPNFIIVLIAAYFNRPSFMDRPQLFSFALYACFLYGAFQYLRNGWKRSLVIALALFQVLWVNTHGAAAIYGLILLGSLVAQRLSEWFVCRDVVSRTHASRELKNLFLVVLIILVCTFISPNTWRTFADVLIYSGNQSLDLVREWQPRGAHGYLIDIAPFWVLAVVALWFGKKHIVASMSMLVLMGYLSLLAYRHGMFFILTALGVTLCQLAYNKKYNDWIQRAFSKPLWSVVATMFVLSCMLWYALYHNISVLQREGYSGFGTASAAEDAYNFIEREKITGNMFNTYAIGDYLLYRGYPNRKVYVDGRTVDYGYDFIREASQAGFDPSVWNRIENKYGITYAVIEYPLVSGASAENDLPYVVHLSRNTDWVLVYIDDKVAVYLKDSAENKTIITKHGYSILTPENIEFGKVFDGLKKDDVVKAEQELERAAESSATGIKAKLLLSHHYTEVDNTAKAQEFAYAAIEAQPYRPEAFEALGIALAGQQQWTQAGVALEKSISLTGGVGLPINYNYLADIFTNAGDVAKSSYYRQKAN